MTCAAVILIEIVLFRIFNPFNNDGCFPLLGLAIDGIKFFILSLKCSAVELHDSLCRIVADGKMARADFTYSAVLHLLEKFLSQVVYLFF